MKREGRQHGVVRTHPILPAPLARQRRYVKTVDSASVTAGLFTKVSRKPTNQSKFTGKCGTTQCLSCHIHPVCRSKNKAKGTMKLRSIDHCPSGKSAIDALAYLASDEGGYEEEEDGIDDYIDHDNVVECGLGVAASVVGEEVKDHEDDEWYFVGDFQ